jgi:hypothetical protein
MKAKIVFLTLLGLSLLNCPIFAQYVPKEKRKKNETRMDTIRQEPKPAQTDNQSTRPSNNRPANIFGKLNVGGNFWLALGNITRIDIQPLVGYPISDKFQMGVGLNYQYYSERGIFNGQNYQFSQSYYGGRGFFQFLFIPQAYLWGEVESINGEYYNRVDGTIQRRWMTAPLVGAGYRQSNSNGFSGGMITVLYNLNYNPDNSIYLSPWVIRVGGFF